MGTCSALTIDDLALLCEREQKKGNGKKKIFISNDDEGNGYHELFKGFSPTLEEGGGNIFHSCCIPLPQGVKGYEIKDYLILG